ncbi:MAG: helix-turn-helix transcriptional regulator [Pseudomonadota bacterium]
MADLNTRPARADDKSADIDPSRDIALMVAERIRMARLNAGKKQAEIASVLKISPQQYQKYETGATRISVAGLAGLAKFYSVPISALIPDHTAMTASGFAEPPMAFPAETKNEDELDYFARIIAILLEIPTKEQRDQVLNRLATITSKV